MNHRQQFKLEGPTGGHLIQAAESALRSDPVTQGFKPSGPKNLQGWKLYNLYGQPAPALHCSQRHISFYPTFSPVTAYTHSLSFSHKAPLGSGWLCLLDNPSLGPGRLLLGLPWSHPFSRLNKTWFLGLPTQGRCVCWICSVASCLSVLGCPGLCKALKDEGTWWWRQRQRRHWSSLCPLPQNGSPHWAVSTQLLVWPSTAHAEDENLCLALDVPTSSSWAWLS